MSIKNAQYQARDPQSILRILKSWLIIFGPDELHAVIDELAKEPEIVVVWGTPFQRRVILPILKYIINPLLFRLRAGLRGRK